MIRLALVGGALLVAILTGYLVQRHLASERARMSALEQVAARAKLIEVPVVEVLVFTKDLPVATITSRSSLGWQKWSADIELNARYITRKGRPDAIKELSGSAARQEVFAGDPVTEEKLIRPGDSSFLAAVLRRGYRAVALPVNETTGVAGLILPGDHIDVILTYTLSGPGSGGADSGSGGGGGGGGGQSERRYGETIGLDLRVLAVDQAFKEKEGATSHLGKTLTVEVDPEQAEALSLARSMGTIAVALRSAHGEDPQRERSRVLTSDSDISGALRQQMQSGQIKDKGDGQARPLPRVLVATRPLDRGTLLSDTDTKWVPMDLEVDLLTEVFVDGRDKKRVLRGSLLDTTVVEGEPLRSADIVQPSDSRFVPLALQPGKRAISIGVSPETAVSGFITPGDYVDVVMTDDMEDPAEGALATRYYGETIVQRVRALSIQSSIDPETNLPETGGTVTVEGTSKQVETILTAAHMGKLALALRPAREAIAGRPGVGAGETGPVMVIAGRDGAPAGGAPRTDGQPGSVDQPPGDGRPNAGAGTAPSNAPSFVTDLTISGGLRWLVLRGDYARVAEEAEAEAAKPAPPPPPPPPKEGMTVFRGGARSDELTTQRVEPPPAAIPMMGPSAHPKERDKGKDGEKDKGKK